MGAAGSWSKKSEEVSKRGRNTQEMKNDHHPLLMCFWVFWWQKAGKWVERRGQKEEEFHNTASPVYLCALFGWNWRINSQHHEDSVPSHLTEKKKWDRCPSFLWSLWRTHCLLTQARQPESSHTLLSDGRCCIPGFIIIIFFLFFCLSAFFNFALRVPSHTLVPHIKISVMIFGFNK